MERKILKVLTQILTYRPDSAAILKSFFMNLNKCNINQMFSQYQLQCLYNIGFIPKDNIKSSKLNQKKEMNKNNQDIEENLQKIIEEDNYAVLQNLVRESDFNLIKTISRPFNEVKKVNIPILHYCIIKKASKCFKFLLLNGYIDPNNDIETEIIGTPNNFQMISLKKYEWDCMAIAIYFGDNEIMQILEDIGIEKGKKSTHLEAALLSYRNSLAKDIIKEMNKNNEEEYISYALLSSPKNSNIKGIELLIQEGNKRNIHKMKDFNDQTVQYAAWYNSKYILEILLAQGANINSTDLNFLKFQI